MDRRKLVMPPKRKYAAISSKWQAAKKRRIARTRAARTNPLVRPRYSTMRSQAVRLGSGPIPNRSFVVLKYCIGYQSDGTTFDKRFNMNSIFSPEYSGGHQPLGRDQYAVLYNRYRVWSCSARISCISQGSVTVPESVTLLANNSTNAYTTYDEACEQKGAITKIVAPGGADATIFYKKWSLLAVTGQTRQGYKDDRYQALMSAKPAEDIILHLLFATTQSAAVASTALQFRVNLEFYTELFDPIPVAQS